MGKLIRGPCCSVVGCSLRSGTNLLSEIEVFRFPSKQGAQRDAWIAAVKREGWTPTSNARICSTHFITGQPSKDPNHPDFVPSKFPLRVPADGGAAAERSTDSSSQSRETPESVEENEMEVEPCNDANVSMTVTVSTAATNVCNDADVSTAAAGPSATVVCNDADDSTTVTASVGTDLSMQDIEAIQKENAALREYVSSLEAKLFQSTATVSTKPELGDDEHVECYTGLPSTTVFFTLLAYLTSSRAPASSTPLSPSDQFLMVLTKLRLGLTPQDLALRFRIRREDVVDVFHRWLDVMARELRCLIHWPSQRDVRKQTLSRLFSRVRCIVDCSEVLMERPTFVNAAAVTYSKYKSHNTVKFLVAVSPSGAITFLSRVWGGRASDKVMVENSGLIDLLDEGDVVLADRGLNFPQYFAAKGVRLMVPAPASRTRPSATELFESKRMTRARIHLERAIGRLNDFNILRNPLPVALIKREDDCNVATIDKILVVCSALTNLSKPTVPI